MSVLWNRLKYVLSPQFDIYEQVANVVRGRIADIGCGTGFGTHLLTAKAKSVCGFDNDGEAVQFARRVFPFDNIRFERGDIETGIQLRDDGYDYITMIDVIEHLEHDERAVANIGAMLSPGGTFICSTPNRMSRYRRAETHYREYSPTELSELLGRIFNSVCLKNYRMENLSSQYENPILAFCAGAGKGI